MTFWGTKAAIGPIEEKLLWRAYRNSPTLFRMVPSPTPYGFPFIEIGGLNVPTKFQAVALPVSEIIGGTQKNWAVSGYAHAPFSPKF